MEKGIREKEIVKVTYKPECQWHVFIYWVSVTAVLEGSFPNSIWLTKKTAFTIHYSFMDVFGKAKMQVKG